LHWLGSFHPAGWFDEIGGWVKKVDGGYLDTFVIYYLR
jgi:hypothetical protein